MGSDHKGKDNLICPVLTILDSSEVHMPLVVGFQECTFAFVPGCMKLTGNIVARMVALLQPSARLHLEKK